MGTKGWRTNVISVKKRNGTEKNINLPGVV